MFRHLRTVALLLTLPAAAFAETPAERGAYLVGTIMTCHNCHTPMGPNGPMFDKALSGGITFDEPPFKVTGSNITQDRETGIGAWSDAEIKRFLRTGTRPNGVQTAPIMPTAYYKILTERDLDGIVAHLRTIAPIRNQVPDPIYKINVPADHVPNAQAPMFEADMADKVKRGFYLATIGHCMECHSPRIQGKLDVTNGFGKGGQKFTGPWGESISANITSHAKAGLGAWSDAEIKRAITQGVSRDGRKLKPPMGYGFYARMNPEDLNALVAYLRTVPPLE